MTRAEVSVSSAELLAPVGATVVSSKEFRGIEIGFGELSVFDKVFLTVESTAFRKLENMVYPAKIETGQGR